MNDNKLIAEFMFEETMPIHQMKYHTDWNWLMPVVQKCYKTESHYVPFDNLVDAVSTLDLGGTYDAVVEFIKTYNDKH